MRRRAPEGTKPKGRRKGRSRQERGRTRGPWDPQGGARQRTAVRTRPVHLNREPGKYSAEAPELPERDGVNLATGEVRKVTEGVDPGWDYNPGRHRTLGINRRDAERSEAILAGRALATTPAPVREQLVRTRIGQSLAASGFRRFLNRLRASAPPRREARAEYVESVPVAVAPPVLRQQAGVSGGLLYLARARRGQAMAAPRSAGAEAPESQTRRSTHLVGGHPGHPGHHHTNPAVGWALDLQRRGARAEARRRSRRGRAARRHLVSPAEDPRAGRLRGENLKRSRRYMRAASDRRTAVKADS